MKTIENGVIRDMTPEEIKFREEVEADSKKEQEEYAKVKYKDDRKEAYPEIGDQLDDLYKKGAFSDEMAAKIKKVKDDNPKS